MSELVERIAAWLEPEFFGPFPGHEPGRCAYCDDSREYGRKRARELIGLLQKIPGVTITEEP